MRGFTPLVVIRLFEICGEREVTNSKSVMMSVAFACGVK